MPMTDFILIGATIAIAIVMVLPAVRRRPLWRATVTPLASIIGSGFLVLAPILNHSYGAWGPAVMAGLCLVAYLFGSAIRYNIGARALSGTRQTAITGRLESAADWTLAFAFLISVAYYLNLLGAFAVSLTPFDNEFNARLVTSGAFLLILVAGVSGGFKALERMEYSTVTIKLAVIAGLLVGMIPYVMDIGRSGGIVLNPPAETGWRAATLAFGLIITVQGFETSRYLGEEYPAALRVRSMRMAQAISTAIYLIYISMFTLAFHAGEFRISETAIIDLMGQVSPLLPFLLVIAAIAAQFSAAVADAGGSGGLTAELTRGRLRVSHGYAILCAAGLVLTWTANIFDIIAFASRAFALYYAIQSAIALSWARQLKAPLSRQLLHAALIILGITIVLAGDSVAG